MTDSCCCSQSSADYRSVVFPTPSGTECEKQGGKKGNGVGGNGMNAPEIKRNISFF
jgi:hypothetical protein